MTSLRQRQPFNYSNPDSDDDDPSDMDETEQEALIDQLQSQTQSADNLYIILFTLLPLVCTPAYLLYLFSGDSSSAVRTLCLLSVTSLALCSLDMWLEIAAVNGTAPAPDSGYSNFGAGGRRRRTAGVAQIPFINVELDSDGPLGRVLPWLNPVICAFLAVTAWGVKGKRNVSEGFWVFLLLPGLMLGVSEFAKRTMRDVRDGIGELKSMRYDYKGA